MAKLKRSLTSNELNRYSAGRVEKGKVYKGVDRSNCVSPIDPSIYDGIIGTYIIYDNDTGNVVGHTPNEEEAIFYDALYHNPCTPKYYKHSPDEISRGLGRFETLENLMANDLPFYDY